MDDGINLNCKDSSNILERQNLLFIDLLREIIKSASITKKF